MRSNNIQEKSYVINTHILYHGVAHDLKKFLLLNKCENLWFIGHEFSSKESRKSFIEYYKKGKLIYYHCSLDYHFLPDTLVYLKDFVYSLFWILLKVKKMDVFFGFGSINCISAIILKKLKTIPKIIFYSIDFAPRRFSNKVLNSIYHWFDKTAVLYSYQVWNLSPRMFPARQKLLNLPVNLSSKQITVPVGVWLNDKDIKRKKRKSLEIIFVGHLIEKQGVQLVLEVMPDLIAKFYNIKFRIIGSGEYGKVLKQLVSDLKIQKNVIFEGEVGDQKRLHKLMVNADIAVAMYKPDKNSFSYYADSTKIKTYLAAGLPIVMTNITHNARNLQKESCALVVRYDKARLLSAIRNLLIRSNIKRYRQNVSRYIRQFDWRRIFQKCFNNI